MKEVGLGRVMPTWKGKRGCMVTVGGDKGKEDKMWQDTRRALTAVEKKIILGRVIEVAIVVAMSTHLYSFGGEVYLQSSGGPIGMRSTAGLAAVVMKMWDKSWIKLLKREGVIFDLLVRYVDDCRMMMASLNEGWTWGEKGFEFSWEKRKEHLNTFQK